MRFISPNDLTKYLITIFLLCFTHSVFADDATDLTNFLQQTTVSGDIKSYYFTRNYSNPNAPPDESAFALGGSLNLESAEFINWFRVDVDIFTSQSLGLNNDNPKQVDNTLPGFDVTSLGQAYLQYQNNGFTVKVGDQLMNTPWLNSIDSRMIPAAYQAIYANYLLTPQLSFIAFRQTGFQSRTSNSYSGLNLYNVNNGIFGGTPLVNLVNTTDIGTLAAGSKYQNSNINSEFWAYQFYDFAKLIYGNFIYTFNNDTSLTPLFGMQVARETGDGNNLLEQFGYGTVDNNIYGVMIGLDIPHGGLTLGYNNIPRENDAFHNGDVVSPYTTGYAADPLYTTSMIQGLVEKSAGSAVKLTANYNVWDDQIKLAVSYAKYYTAPIVANTNETDFDITYLPCGKYKGLSLRDRIGYMRGNITDGEFGYNRLMLVYDF
jgi:hypothetical protein